MKETAKMANAHFDGLTGRIDGNNPYRETSLADQAAACLREAGRAATGSTHSIVNQALTASAFPEVPAHIITQSAGAVEIPAPHAAWTGIGYNPTFRPGASARMTAGGPFEEIGSGGEIGPAGSPVDGVELGQVKTWGTIFGVDRRVFVDNDVQQLYDLGPWLRQRGVDTIAFQVCQHLEANSALSDGTELFHADRGNLLTGASSVLDADGLDAASAALRGLTDSSGTKFNCVPQVLVVPPALETQAAVVLRTMAGATRDRLELVVQPELTDANAWYLFPDPSISPVIRVLALAGQKLVPSVSSRVTLSGENVEFRAVLDFGTVSVSARAVKSAGE